MPSELLYQPFWSGLRAGVTVTAGAVASYASAKFRPVTLPATSVQLPLAIAVALSGPPYVLELHEAMPEVTSLPLQSIRPQWLYQPFWSGLRAGVGGVRGGPVPSDLRRKVAEEMLRALS